MGKKKSAAWMLPKPTPSLPMEKGEVQPKRHGEPRFHLLERFNKNDTILRTDLFNSCCDCGLGHHRLFAVIRHRGRWWLEERTYRTPGTGKKRRKRG